MVVDASKLGTFEEIDAARTANRDADGRIRNLALSRRLDRRDRSIALAVLGYEDETVGGRLAATTGELRQWAVAALRA